MAQINSPITHTPTQSQCTQLTEETGTT